MCASADEGLGHPPLGPLKKLSSKLALTQPAELYLMSNLNTDFNMQADQLSITFKALADPTRRAILARLSLGEVSVLELARPFDMSLPAISQHLKVLEKAGLVTRSRDAQWRPCRLDAVPPKEAADWLEHYRRFWDQSFDRLDAYVRELQGKGKHHARKK